MAGLISPATLSSRDCFSFSLLFSQIPRDFSAVAGFLRVKNGADLHQRITRANFRVSGNAEDMSKSRISVNTAGSLLKNGIRGTRPSKSLGSSEYSDSSGGLEKLDFDIVIVGAGVIGLTIARQLLLNTDLSVAIVDAKGPCAGATGAGQGYIWMGYRTPESDKWELEARSKHLWEEFVQEVEASGLEPLKLLGWKKTGSLLVGTTSEDSAALQERVKLLSKAGIRAEFVSAASMHQIEPAVEVGKEGGAAFIPDDSQIDAKLAVSFIQEKNRLFTSQGRYEEFFEEPAVRFLRSNRKGDIEGVQTSKRVLYGNKAVILAAGAWSCSLVEKMAEELSFPLHVPVRPRKGHLLVLERPQTLQLSHGLMEIGYCNHQIASVLPDVSPTNIVHSSLHTLSVSMTATIDSEGSLVLGSSRQFAGFDCEPEDVVVNSIFERAAKFLPALNKISLRELLKGGHIRIGLRPYMPDGKPIIGPVPNLPKLMLATGHEGAGLCMAFGTAEMVVDMILGNATKVDCRPFSPKDRCCK